MNTDRRQRGGQNAWLVPSLVVGFLLLLCTAIALIILVRWQRELSEQGRATRDSQALLADVGQLLSDAETSQRGYLLTGRQSYLVPYDNARTALPPALERLKGSLAGDSGVTSLLVKLQDLSDAKIAELQQTIDMRSRDNAAGALELVNSDAGKQLTDESRVTIAALRDRLQRALTTIRERSETLTQTRENLLLFIAIAILVFGGFVLFEARAQFRALEAARTKLRAEESSRLQAETQVRQLQKMEAIGQLTGGIAHDFNNMLGVITVSLESAKLKFSAEGHASENFIDVALSATQRAATLTARLLAFARQQPLSPTVVDANKLLSGMTEMLRRTLGESVMSEFVLGGGLWKVFVDPIQLEMCLINLAVNARDAMESGGKLTIETHNASLDDRYASEHADVKAGQYVLLSVTDTGAGMSSDIIERAFEPFFTTKPVGRGTGLGLSQVFGFVKQSGGHVKIYSEAGCGTTVKIYLPRYVGEGAENAKPTTIASELPGGSTDKVILLVEDEESLRMVAQTVLTSLGYTVLETGSPVAALQIVRDHPNVALLFTDIVMPEMNGRQLADEAKKLSPNLRVLYTTGYTRNAIIHNGIVDDGVELLQKPFSVSQLATKVREVLER